MVTKIISGGQTGAERTGIDIAIEIGIGYGGSIPTGRRTEEGELPESYTKIIELESESYPFRTEKNVLDSDAAVIFTRGKVGAGSALTLRLAKKHQKPYLHIDLRKHSRDKAVRIVEEWLREVHSAVMNVAGSRKSTAVGIYHRVFNSLKEVLGNV